MDLNLELFGKELKNIPVRNSDTSKYCFYLQPLLMITVVADVGTWGHRAVWDTLESSLACCNDGIRSGTQYMFLSFNLAILVVTVDCGVTGIRFCKVIAQNQIHINSTVAKVNKLNFYGWKIKYYRNTFKTPKKTLQK